ncbi:MAG: VOC family protein [Bryobacterales bacterium]|nr:VOC family protein [Bryobacterales bacterium]
MPDTLRHFAINCDDVDRARGFYEKVFGWKFQPWGPPGFFNTSDPGVMAAIQPRREIVPGLRMAGMECSFGVADIDVTQAAVESMGGKILMPKVTIPTVGTLIFFQDPEGNVVGAMQYEKAPV